VYYQPLFYYLTSVFRALGASSARALMLATALPYLMIGAIAYRAFSRQPIHGWALAGIVLVVSGPPLFFISTHMGLLPWTLGIPFSVLFVMESTRERPRPAVIALLLGLTCLSHILSGLMALCCAGLSRVVLTRLGRPSIGATLAWGMGIIVGLGLASFFIYPAITQLHLINPNGWTSDRTFDWRTSMLFPTFTYVRFGARWMSYQWPLPLIVFGMTLFVLLNRSARTPAERQALPIRLAVAAMSALALGSELAYPLYAVLPPLQKLQFPYRFLPLAAVLGTLAFVLHLHRGGWNHAGKRARAIAVALILASCAQGLFLQVSLARSGKHLPDPGSYMSGYFGQVEYLPAVRGPHWKAYVDKGLLAGECASLNIACQEEPLRRTHDYSALVDTPRQVGLRLPVFAYPAWQLSVDGRVRPLSADSETGLVSADLAPGHHVLALRWVGLPAERTGRYITLGALSAFAFLVVLSRRSRRRDDKAV
jgi:hypothetical protein